MNHSTSKNYVHSFIMNRKKIKRTNTCDLTLGGVVAPPPSGPLSAPVVGDIIDCFDHNGEPLASSDLVPVAMVMHTLYIQYTCTCSWKYLAEVNFSSVTFKS